VTRMREIQVDEEVFRELQRLATPFVDTPNTVLRRLLLGEGRTPPDDISTRERRVDALLEDTDEAAERASASGAPGDLRESRASYQARMFAEHASVGPYSSLGHERRAARGMSPRRFGKLLCAREFPGEMFARADRERGSFRTLFESEERLLYFLNFNKPGATNLWYKLTGTAIEALTAAEKAGYIAFTNPAERLAWVIPIADLRRQHEAALGRPLGAGDFDLNIDVKADRLRELDWGIEAYRREV